MSFTDDKTVATNSVHNLCSPRGLTVGRNNSSLEVPATSSKVGDSTSNDDTKSVYSAVTGLSLASAWNLASTATSIRRRHFYDYCNQYNDRNFLSKLFPDQQHY